MLDWILYAAIIGLAFALIFKHQTAKDKGEEADRIYLLLVQSLVDRSSYDQFASEFQANYPRMDEHEHPNFESSQAFWQGRGYLGYGAAKELVARNVASSSNVFADMGRVLHARSIGKSIRL